MFSKLPRFSRPKFPKIPLQAVLVVPFVLQVVLAVGLTGLLAYYSGQQAVKELANQVMQEVGNQVIFYLDRELEAPHLVNQLNVDALRAGWLPGLEPQDPARLQQYVATNIQRFSSVSMVAIANNQGGLVGATHWPEEQLSVYSTSNFSKGPLQGTSQSKNGTSETTGVLVSDFDARLQPWYQAAVKAGDATWSEITRFNDDTRKATYGIVASLPYANVQGQLEGVLAAGIDLQQISKFLRTTHRGDSGQIFIIEPSGLLVASSNVGEMSRTPQRIQAADSHNLPMSDAVLTMREEFGELNQLSQPESFEIVTQGERQFGQMLPFEDEHGLKWLVVVLVPESEFMNQINANTRSTVLLSIAALFGAIAFGVLTSDWIVDPILRLSRASRAMALGQWDLPVDESSRIEELEVLARSFNQMGEHLQESFDQVKTALLESEERFTTVFRSSPDAISIVSMPDCRYLEVNESFLRLSGFHRDAVIDHTPYELNLVAQPEQAQLLCNLVTAEGQVRNFEMEFCNNRQEVFIMLMSAGMIELDGKPYMLAVARDITERKRLELALQESEAKLKDVLNTVIAAINCFRVYPDHRIVFEYFSESHEKVFGYTAAELEVDNTLWDTGVHPEDVNRTLLHLLPARGEDAVLTTEYRFYHKDGRLRWILDNLTMRWEEARQCWFVTAVAIDITDRKQAEEELRHSEESLREAQRVAHIGSWSYQLTHDHPIWSGELFNIFGRDASLGAPSVGEILDHCVHPGDRDVLRRLVEQAISTGQPFCADIRILHPDQAMRFVEFRGNPVFDDTTQVVGLVGTALDITDRKRAEDALQYSEKQLRQITDSLPAYICYLDTNQCYQFINRTYEDWFGRPRTELYGKHIQELLGEADYATIQPYLEYALAGNPISYTVERVNSQGMVRSLEVSLVPDVGSEGQVLGCYSLVLDVSSRNQAEAALRESEARFRSAFNNTAVGMALVSLQGQILDANTALCRILGYSKIELLTHSFQEITFSEDLEQYLNLRDRALMGELPWYQMEKRCYHRDGSIIWGQLSVSLVRDDQQQPLYFVAQLQDITRRKQIEEALRRSEEQRQLSVELNNIGTWDWNVLTNEVVWNENHFHILGFDPETCKASQQIWQDAIHPDDRERMQAAVLQQTLNLGPVEEEYRIVRPDGTVRWVLSRGQVLTDEAGKPVRILGVLLDISERKRLEAERKTAEVALSRSETTRQAILKALPDLLIRMRGDGTVLGVLSNGSVRVLNADVSFQCSNIYEALPQEIADKRMVYVRRALETGEPQHYEYELEVAGTRQYEEARIVVSGEDEVLVVVRDISERKRIEIERKQAELERQQVEAQLAAQRIFLQQVLDIVPSLVFVQDWDGRFILANRAIADVNGTTPEALIGRLESDFGVVPLEQEAEFIANNREVMTTLQPKVIVPEAVRTVDGTTRWYQTILIPFLDSEGKLQGVLGCATDISDLMVVEASLRTAKEAAEAASRAKSNFLASMSHELRSPLNAILGFTQLLQRNPELTTLQQEALETICRNGYHLLNLINDVLSISKIEANRVTLDANQFDLFELLDRLHHSFLLPAQSKGLHWVCDRSSDVPQYIQADERKLTQVLYNLVDNAIKFTRMGTIALQVRLGSRSSESAQPENTDSPNQCSLWLNFAIEDSGPGLTPTEQTRIFEPFVQTETGRQMQQGTGLGLTLSQRFVQVLGGELTVESNVGVGTRFAFEIPVEVLPEETVQPSGRQGVVTLAAGQPRQRVLVVDDNPENVQLLECLLELVGFEVVTATGGQQAIAQWESTLPNLILIDLQMPEMDGCAATREIRRREWERGLTATSPTRIIALTASVFDADRQRMREAGANAFISKPYSETELLETIREQLGVEYSYQEPPKEARSPILINPTQVTEELQQLPGEWRERLLMAVTTADEQSVRSLLQEIPEQFLPLHQTLTAWVDDFQFNRILQVLQQMLERTA